VKNQIRLKKR